jgi:HK97 family phage prohead protease
MKSIYSCKGLIIPASFKDADEKRGIVTGYFSHFGNVDSDGDIMRMGAFQKTIRENGPASSQPRIKHLLNHNPSQPLGVIKELKEDATGLYYESEIGTHKLGKDFIDMVKSGLISEHSIGFQILKRNQLQDYEGFMKNPVAGWYEITEVKLYEGSSLTAWGANSLTPLTGMKGAFDLDQIIERQKSIESFCRKSEASDETIQMLLLHSKQLTQIILEAKQSTPPSVDTVPVNDLKDALNKFSQLIKTT